MNMLKKFTEEDKKETEWYIDQIYQRFINHVEVSRKSKLKLSKEQRDKEIYTSGVFFGDRAVELG
jgi:ClpP class serine protease